MYGKSRGWFFESDRRTNLYSAMSRKISVHAHCTVGSGCQINKFYFSLVTTHLAVDKSRGERNNAEESFRMKRKICLNDCKLVTFATV